MRYWALAVAAFHRQTQYRLAMAAGLFTNVVFGFIRSAIMFAALDSGGSAALAGYTKGSVSAYIWLSQGLLGAVLLGMGSSEIGERIRTGDIAIDLIRPVDVQLSYLAGELGRATYTFIPRGVPSVLVGALTFGLVLPATPLPYLLGLVSIVLAVGVSFLVRFLLVDVAGFWVTQNRGILTVYTVSATFLAGLFVPVHIFPDWLRAVARLTPFPSMLQAPVDVLSGRVLGGEAVQVVGLQLGWFVLALVLGRVVLRRATRKLVVGGG
ncbi:MAG TPA: ABC-2 family transporter protein [Dermatophilaceae bacterium]|nr:ABC-2 family transporter protein [Dermatophilaceae bacterium]